MSSFTDEDFSSEEFELTDWLELPRNDGGRDYVSARRNAVIAVESTPSGARIRLCDGSGYDTSLSYEEVMKRV